MSTSTLRFINPTLSDGKGRNLVAEVGSPVRSGHLPDWLRQRVLAVLDPKPHAAGWAVLVAVQEQFGGSWLDHFGSTKIKWAGQEIVAFVSEPYMLGMDGIKAAMRFAEATGCELHISATSEWFPTRTLRLLFVPADETATGKRGGIPR